MYMLGGTLGVTLSGCGKSPTASSKTGEPVVRSTDGKVNAKNILDKFISRTEIQNYDPDLADLLNETYDITYGGAMPKDPYIEFVKKGSLGGGTIGRGWSNGQIYLEEGLEAAKAFWMMAHEIAHVKYPSTKEYLSQITAIRLSQCVYSHDFGISNFEETDPDELEKILDRYPGYRPQPREPGSLVWGKLRNPLMSVLNDNSNMLSEETIKSTTPEFKYYQSACLIIKMLSQGKTLSEIEDHFVRTSIKTLDNESMDITTKSQNERKEIRHQGLTNWWEQEIKPSDIIPQSRKDELHDYIIEDKRFQFFSIDN